MSDTGVLIADRLVDELAERLPRRARLLARQVHVVEDQDEGAARECGRP